MAYQPLHRSATTRGEDTRLPRWALTSQFIKRPVLLPIGTSDRGSPFAKLSV